MTKKRWLILGIFFILFTGLTVLWRWTPVANWLSVQALTTWASEFRRSASAPFWIIAAFVIAGQVFFPITVLSLATVFAFGPLFGAIYSFLGPLLAGLMTYTIGRVLGEATICRLAGSSVEKIRQQVKAHGLATSITIHILPVAPFTLVNLFSGACGISARDFVLGTLIGQLPGVLSIILFQHQLTRAIKSPDPVNITFVVAIIAAVTAGTLWLQRRVTRKTPNAI